MSSYHHQKTCLCCGSSNINLIFQLKDAPLTDAYRDNANIALKCTKYPLNLMLCRDCNHLQLAELVLPELSYENYFYNSAVTLNLPANFVEYAKILKSSFDIENPTLLDVGSNDGSFIKSCINEGIDAYGIEPSKHLAESANKQGCRTLNGYFDESVEQGLKTNKFPEKYDIVIFNNVLANLKNPLQALTKAKEILKDNNSVIGIQTGYHPIQFSKGLFDYIYHEHYSYFSLKSLSILAMKAGLYLDRYEKSNLRGGSIRCFLKLQDKNISIESERFCNQVENEGLFKLVELSAKHLKETIVKLRSDNFKIIGYGASHSTGILVHQFELQNLLDGLVDENPNKLSKYMPGTSLEVEKPSTYINRDKICFVILAWQYYDQILAKLRESGFQGQIIKPVLP